MADEPAPSAESRQEQPLLSEFLNMDPDTGDVCVYLFDGEVMRPATADEITASYDPSLCIKVRRGLGEAKDATHPEDEEGVLPGEVPLHFADRYERAFGPL